MSAKNKSVSETVMPWLKANLGKECLGCLTGQSYRALKAAVQIVDLYSSCDCRHQMSAVVAFKNVVLTIDPGQERELVYHAIAHVLDWSDRDKVWHMAGLEPLASVRRCAFE